MEKCLANFQIKIISIELNHTVADFFKNKKINLSIVSPPYNIFIKKRFMTTYMSKNLCNFEYTSHGIIFKNCFDIIHLTVPMFYDYAKKNWIIEIEFRVDNYKGVIKFLQFNINDTKSYRQSKIVTIKSHASKDKFYIHSEHFIVVEINRYKVSEESFYDTGIQSSNLINNFGIIMNDIKVIEPEMKFIKNERLLPPLPPPLLIDVPKKVNNTTIINNRFSGSFRNKIVGADCLSNTHLISKWMKSNATVNANNKECYNKFFMYKSGSKKNIFLSKIRDILKEKKQNEKNIFQDAFRYEIQKFKVLFDKLILDVCEFFDGSVANNKIGTTLLNVSINSKWLKLHIQTSHVLEDPVFKDCLEFIIDGIENVSIESNERHRIIAWFLILICVSKTRPTGLNGPIIVGHHMDQYFNIDKIECKYSDLIKTVSEWKHKSIENLKEKFKGISLNMIQKEMNIFTFYYNRSKKNSYNFIHFIIGCCANIYIMYHKIIKIYSMRWVVLFKNEIKNNFSGKYTGVTGSDKKNTKIEKDMDVLLDIMIRNGQLSINTIKECFIYIMDMVENMIMVWLSIKSREGLFKIPKFIDSIRQVVSKIRLFSRNKFRINRSSEGTFINDVSIMNRVNEIINYQFILEIDDCYCKREILESLKKENMFKFDKVDEISIKFPMIVF